MDSITVVNSFLREVEAGNFANAAEYLTEDFQFIGPAPEPLGANEYIAVQGALVSAMPNWKFNDTDWEEEAPGEVTVTVAVSGTFTHELNLPAMGLVGIQPTEVHGQNASENITVTVVDGKISCIDVEPTPDAGIAGFLRSVGVEIPQTVSNE